MHPLRYVSLSVCPIELKKEIEVQGIRDISCKFTRIPQARTIYLYVAVAVLSLNLVLYLAPQLIMAIFFSRPQNLKKKYNADWALVTGASSGECG